MCLLSLRAVSGTLRRGSCGRAEILGAGAFSMQRLEGSRFGTVVLWVLNGGAGGESWGGWERMVRSSVSWSW